LGFSACVSVERITEIRSLVTAELDRHQWVQAAELTRQHARVIELKRQQQKLIEARYTGAIPLDLLKSEQERILREFAGGQQIIERYSNEVAAVMRMVDEALLLCADAELAEPFTLFLTADFAAHLRSADATVRNGPASKAAVVLEANNPALDQQEPGSNIPTWVDLRGRLSRHEIRSEMDELTELISDFKIESEAASPRLDLHRRWWALEHRLSETARRQLVEDRLAGMTHAALVGKYGISLSSVKRILRRSR
jgi:hypothetical protein